jgi:hypothetical protein
VTVLLQTLAIEVILISGFGPEEWPWCGIVVGDDGGDGLQFLYAAVNTAADLAIARPFGKPRFDRRRLVGGVLSMTRWNIEIGRYGSVMRFCTSKLSFETVMGALPTQRRAHKSPGGVPLHANW